MIQSSTVLCYRITYCTPLPCSVRSIMITETPSGEPLVGYGLDIVQNLAILSGPGRTVCCTWHWVPPLFSFFLFFPFSRPKASSVALQVVAGKPNVYVPKKSDIGFVVAPRSHGEKKREEKRREKKTTVNGWQSSLSRHSDMKRCCYYATELMPWQSLSGSQGRELTLSNCIATLWPGTRLGSQVVLWQTHDAAGSPGQVGL